MKYWILMMFSMALLSIGGCGGESTDSSADGGADGDGGSTARFAIQQGFLVTLDGGAGIATYELDATNGATRQIAYFNVLGGGVETLRAYEDDKLLMGTQTGSIVLQVTDDGYLYDVASISHARSCDPVIAVEETMYITLRNGRGLSCGGSDSNNHLHVWDISNLSAPALRASIPLNQPYGLSALNNRLYVCTADGLVSFDITNRWGPQQIAIDSRWMCDDVIAREDTLYLTQFDGGIQILSDDLEPLSDLLKGE